MILIVEDDVNITEVIKMVISLNGLVCDSTDCWEKAIDKICHSPPKIILLDMLLLDGDASPVLELCVKSYPAIKLVLMTAMQNCQIELIMTQFNLTHLIKKPFTLEQLEEMILPVTQSVKNCHQVM